MRKLVIGLLFVLVAMPTAFAQWEQRATVTVPFEFAVDNTVLPAGTYEVFLDPQTHGVRLLNRDAQVSATVLSHDMFLIPSGVATSSKLMFALEGKQHVLHQVMVEGDNHIHDLIHGSEVAEFPGKPAT